MEVKEEAATDILNPFFMSSLLHLHFSLFTVKEEEEEKR